MSNPFSIYFLVWTTSRHAAMQVLRFRCHHMALMPRFLRSNARRVPENQALKWHSADAYDCYSGETHVMVTVRRDIVYSVHQVSGINVNEYIGL